MRREEMIPMGLGFRQPSIASARLISFHVAVNTGHEQVGFLDCCYETE